MSAANVDSNGDENLKNHRKKIKEQIEVIITDYNFLVSPQNKSDSKQGQP